MHDTHTGWAKYVPTNKPDRNSNHFQYLVDMVITSAMATEEASVIEIKKIRNPIRKK